MYTETVSYTHLGRENAKSYLTAHPEIMEEIEEKVRAHYGIGAEGQEAEEPAQAAPADAEEVMLSLIHI